LPIAYCLLPIACCLLPVAYCLLPVASSYTMKKKPLNKAYLRKNYVATPLKLWMDQSATQDVKIEVVPLIDVIFCILTFFILASVTFSRQQAIRIDLPRASTGTPQMREMLIISLNEFGQLYVEQELVTKAQLYQALSNYRLLNPNGLMVLNANKEAKYNDVIETLDVLRQVGGDRVALATLPANPTEVKPKLSQPFGKPQNP